MLEEQITPEKQKPSIMTIVIGLIVVATIGISLWALFKTPANVPAVEINIPAAMTPEEQAYAQSLRIENVALSRAENFIHQEVTILNADVINDGPRSLQRLMVDRGIFQRHAPGGPARDARRSGQSAYFAGPGAKAKFSDFLRSRSSRLEHASAGCKSRLCTVRFNKIVHT